MAIPGPELLSAQEKLVVTGWPTVKVSSFAGDKIVSDGPDSRPVTPPHNWLSATCPVAFWSASVSLRNLERRVVAIVGPSVGDIGLAWM